MEIGDKITKSELTKDGWELFKEVPNCGTEIWSKGTRRLMWRVKYESIYLLWDKGRKRK